MLTSVVITKHMQNSPKNLYYTYNFYRVSETKPTIDSHKFPLNKL